METGEMIAVAGGTIKIVIDIVAWVIPTEKRKYIPLVAIALGIAWSVFLLGGNLADALIVGVAIGATAIGVNEVASVSKKKELTE